MKVWIVCLVVVLILVASLIGVKFMNNSVDLKDNPLVKESFYETDSIDFSKIDESMYLPAVEYAIDLQRKQIKQIKDQVEEPDFVNTIVALDQAGSLLTNIVEVFFHLTHAAFTPKMEEIEESISQQLSQVEDEILYDKDLFEKIKSVYDRKDSLSLDDVELRLVEKTYKNFTKNGSLLDKDKQARLQLINKQLVALTTKFSQNLLKEASTECLLIPTSDKKRLDGVDNVAIESFEQEAKQKGKSGYCLSFINPRVKDILKYGSDRSLRKELIEFYQNKGKNANSSIVLEVMKLRLEKAKILGFSNWSEYILKDNSMAYNPQSAYGLLNSILPLSLEKMKQDGKELEKLAKQEEKVSDFELNIWDWQYYTEKLRKKKFDYDANELKKYFNLVNVKQGVFGALTKLYGVSFSLRSDLPLYYKSTSENNQSIPDIDTYEVFDKDGSSLGVLYLDYFARSGKKSGAWSTSIKSKKGILNEQGKVKDYERPIEVVVFNFPRPDSLGNCLLSLVETETFFHEVGHAINAFFIEPRYRSLSDSYRDFVELPSQLFEHWATDREYLPTYAKHYQTGKAIGEDYIKKIEDSRTFDQGFFVSRQLFLGLEDLGWHSLKKIDYSSEAEFEEALLKDLGLEPRYDYVPRSYQFSHIISTGYDSRYYSYMWSDMLVEDAFELFKQKGIFNQQVASDFRRYILSIASSRDCSESYRQFRGKDPSIDALVKKFGFVK